MNYYNLLLGVSLLILGVGYLFYNLNKTKKITKKDGMVYPSQVKMNMAIIGIIILGILMLYRELQKIL